MDCTCECGGEIILQEKDESVGIFFEGKFCEECEKVFDGSEAVGWIDCDEHIPDIERI
tara:strand:- start:195 stop:368 length:174 start_codon:yes stop_codon:yes gene_type:complete